MCSAFPDFDSPQLAIAPPCTGAATLLLETFAIPSGVRSCGLLRDYNFVLIRAKPNGSVHKCAPSCVLDPRWFNLVGPMDQDEFDRDDDFNYDEVALEDDGVDGGDDLDIHDDDQALDALVRSVQATKDRDAPPPVRADLTRLPVVVDDFIRNFFVKHNLLKTLDTFELEWYQRYGANPEDEPQHVPDVYLENARLIDRTAELEREVAKHKDISSKAMTLWERVKKERDLHRMNHHRVMQEKSTLSRDLKRLQSHSMSIEPTVNELRQKYEQCQKEKMLLKLERDKLAGRIQTLEENVRDLEGPKDDTKKAKSAKSAAASGPAWPADNRPNVHLTTTAKPPANASSLACRQTFKAHAMTVTTVALHPKKPVVASCSDDGSWRLSSLPQGEAIMSGEGHKDWIAGIAINGKGTMAATASGDKTVKLWDFGATACKHTLKAHTDGVWCVDFHDTSELLASGSLDHSTRVWDVETGKCRQTLRGHVDAVNSVVWQPFTNTLYTGSGDKTVSLWDARANFCAQTFYGHHNAVTKVAVPLRGDQLVSCDADGNVILWDVRMIEQKQVYQCGPHPANSVAFDKSGSLVAVASDDGTIKIISLLDDKISVLKGHDDAVQCAVFDMNTNGFLVSCGSDTTVRYWS
jgi:WD40 repeat protein